MSFSNTFFSPKEKIIQEYAAIHTHLEKVVTSVDRISISFNNQVIQGNFGFTQKFRKVIPIINIQHPHRPPPHTEVHVQYHGMGSCWSFTTSMYGYSPQGDWLLKIPTSLTKNEARRAARFFLSEDVSWRFCSNQALGNFRLRDLSTMGCSLYFDSPNLVLHTNEKLRGTITFHKHLHVPLCLQVRHISQPHNAQMQKVAGCSFEEISDWSRVQIDEELQRLPNSDLRRI